MKRVIIFIGAVVLLLAPTSTALARGDGWQPVVINSFDWSCGPTTVHVTVPVNKEYFRNIPQPGGIILQQVTGFLSFNFATDAGKSVQDNISGPAKSLIYPNGDFEGVGTGQGAGILTEQQAQAIGLPQIFISSGPIHYILHPDGSITWIRIPNVKEDVCAELG